MNPKYITIELMEIEWFLPLYFILIVDTVAGMDVYTVRSLQNILKVILN